jgi:TonB-dependent SusC/RagA subfamily outer membrane receptor
MRSLSDAGLCFCGLVILSSACASHNKNAPPITPPTVSAKDIENNAGVPIERLLESKVPGINVQRTADGGVAIEIRGTNSFYSGTHPLYVIDDVEVAPGNGGALMGVNPYDIETIRVLKNPEDTAIYGVRGANGVILITTKRSFQRPK